MRRTGRAGLLTLAAAIAALAACHDEGSSRSTNHVSGRTPYASGCGGSASGSVYVNAEVEPFIAANPADPDNLVGVWQQDRWNSGGGARGVMAAVSVNGGVSWTRRQLPFSQCAGGTAANGGDYARATDPWVGIGPDGIAYFMALAFSDDPSAMLVSRSTDGGFTWGPINTLARSEDPLLFHDKNSLTADPFEDGHAYAVWDRFDFATEQAPVFFSRTTDGGLNWDAARIVYDPGDGFGTIGNVIAVLPDGTLVDLFTEFDHTTGVGLLRVLRSTDKGLNWSAPVTIDEILFAGTFDPVTGLAVRGGGFLGSIAVGPTGTLHVAWQDARFSAGAVDGIALSSSEDGGLTWSAPVQVNGAPAADAFTPSVAVSPGGTIGVTYYDWRDNTGAPTLPTAYWLATSDDGVNWTEQEVGESFDLSTAALSGCCALFVGDYQGLAVTAESFLPFYGATNPSTSNRSDIRFEAMPVAGAPAKRGYVARRAGAYAVTPQWRARVAARLAATRPEREAPPLRR